VNTILKLSHQQLAERIIHLQDEFPRYRKISQTAGGKQKTVSQIMGQNSRDKLEEEIHLAELGKRLKALDILSARIKQGYNPIGDASTQLFPVQGFGMKPVKVETKPVKLPPKKAGDLLHIDINSHNGKNYKMGEGGFMQNRIRIGRGIEVEEKPRYEGFGKFVIHIPQLMNENVLNVKYRSLGGVPSIKPAIISNNFKDFILNTIDNKKVNSREFDNLTKAEKDAFTKMSKGAGLLETFKLKNSTDENFDNDIQRFNVLKGEFDAGNNNDKLIKELKGLVIKFMSIGKLNKKLGSEFLMQLNLS
jgi:hypothetical protein